VTDNATPPAPGRERCAPRSRCNRWRDCDDCNRIRQARFADEAEAAAVYMLAPALWVFVPLSRDPAELAKIREWFQRHYKPAAAVWSIEYGHKSTGWHLNVIADHARADAPPGVRVYCERIKGTIRTVAAYITKGSQRPPRDDAIKRVTGYLGNWKKPTDAAAPASPLISATLHMQRSTEPKQPSPVPGPERPSDTARRHLAELYALGERLQRSDYGVTIGAPPYPRIDP
jgi:hypothetical protein